MITQKEMEAKSDHAKKEGFRRWMQEPMTRALVSMIPPCEQLEIILQAAYESGFQAGSDATAVSFLEAMMKSR